MGKTLSISVFILTYVSVLVAMFLVWYFFGFLPLQIIGGVVIAFYVVKFLLNLKK